MNAMWIDTNLRKAADWHFKEHQKLILEAAQMLSTALHEYGVGHLAPYQKSYVNHPLNVWVRQSSANWFKLREYASALHDSFYGYDYDGLRKSYERGADLDRMDEEGYIHKSFKKIVRMEADDVVEMLFPNVGLTARPRPFGHGFDDPGPHLSTEEAYREYYKFNLETRSESFTTRGEPEWLKK
jgi:hypothetical protein